MASRAQYDCSSCSASFAIDSETGGGVRELTPVACPGCGGLVFVEVAAHDAFTLQYRVLSQQRTTQECNGCARVFAVVYYGDSDESRCSVPVGCPFCGWVNHASVAESVTSVAEGVRYEATKQLPDTRKAASTSPSKARRGR